MRVFVTGAGGGVGSAVVPELVSAGHTVVGLARSDRSAEVAARAGAEVLRGDVSDLDLLRRSAADSDGVVHLAFDHGFTEPADFERAADQERAAVLALGGALVGSGRPLVVASGTPLVPGRASTEDDPMPTEGPVGGRGRSARAALDLADRDVRSSVVRLPRSVHRRGADGAFGFAGFLVDAARTGKVSGYVGDGTQRWPAVHRLDAARLFRIALEEAGPGSVLHAVADEGDPMRALAEAIGGALDLPVEAVPAESFGPFLGAVFGFDQPSSSALTRERYGWSPVHPSLLDDLRSGDYPAAD